MNKSRAIRPMKVHALTVALLALTATSANAFEFKTEGDWYARFDTTISYGASWRVSDLDPENVGKAYFDPLNSTLTNAERRASIGRWSVWARPSAWWRDSSVGSGRST